MSTTPNRRKLPTRKTSQGVDPGRLLASAASISLLVLLGGSVLLALPGANAQMPGTEIATTSIATEQATLTPTPSSTPPPTITSTPFPTETTAALSPSPVASAELTPLPIPDDKPRTLWVPILMYHYVSVPPEGADPYRINLSISPDRFHEQMAWLKDNGYETISLYDLVYALNTGQPELPEKPVIVTFDDGYIDNYENAFPVLYDLSFTATFFILTDVVDLGTDGYMTWDQLAEMKESGMDVEVHGRWHEGMANRSYDWLVFHLLGPAETIEATLGYRPRLLAYPSGSYDAYTIEIARQAGYWAAVTTASGREQEKDRIFELQRVRVLGSWSLPVFAAVMGQGE